MTRGAFTRFVARVGRARNFLNMFFSLVHAFHSK